jgi:hypothetical protein
MNSWIFYRYALLILDDGEEARFLWVLASECTEDQPQNLGIECLYN